MEKLVAQRIEELRLANEHLSELSFVDTLTGLSNRRRLNSVLDKEWRRASREHTTLGLVMADIEGFKPYNDSLGHQEGDHCLSAVAAVLLLSAGRASDLAARYGGEEMVFLMPGAELAVTMTEKLRAACKSLAIHHPTSPVSRVVTISLGMAACIPSTKSSTEFLVEQADAALYRARNEGRNRVSE